MSALFYPALFHEAEEGGFWVTFPVLPECMTEGDDMIPAYEMAVDALELAISCRIKDGDPLPPPSAPEDIPLADGEFVRMISYHLFSSVLLDMLSNTLAPKELIF